MQTQENPSSDQFKSFQMPRKEMQELDVVRYRVYSGAREYVVVIADSAAEAMRKAKIAEPCKVTREFPLYRTLLSPDWIGAQPNGETEAAEMPAAAPAPAEAAAPLPS